MLCKLARMLLVSGVVSGLCASVQANTTAADDYPLAAPELAQIRIALLLPTRSGMFGAAADALRTGFLTAYEYDKQGVSVDLIESGDAPADMLAAYQLALPNYDIIVGPLSRTGVALIAQSGYVDKPTVALTQPEGERAVPPKMLVVALSVEEEAEQVAAWIARGKNSDQSNGQILALSTATGWQRRSAQAFAAQGKRLGMAVSVLELSDAGSVLSESGLAQLKQRIDADQPVALFVALDAAQATQLRSVVGSAIPLYGISQMNPRSLSADPDERRWPELNGVKLVDIPWQLQSDDPVVMLYPRPIIENQQTYHADLDRLYALGIDAYRVAREIGRARSNFDIDGVTGKLSVSISAARSHFERIETPALYQDGMVVPAGR